MESNSPPNSSGQLPPGWKIDSGRLHPDGSQRDDAQTVTVNGKQIPSGEPPESRALQYWNVTGVHPVIPKIPKPLPINQVGQIGERVREAVLSQLEQMKPDITADQIRWVSESHKEQMLARIAQVKQSLGMPEVKQTLLIDFDEDDDCEKVISHALKSIGLRLQQTEQDMLQRVNADNKNVETWKAGFKEAGTLHKAWTDLHNVVVEICRHEPLIIETPPHTLPPSSAYSADLMDMDIEVLPTPPMDSLERKEVSEDRFYELEQRLITQQNQLNALMQAQAEEQQRAFQQQLAIKERQISALQNSQVSLSASNVRLQEDLTALKSKISTTESKAQPDSIESDFYSRLRESEQKIKVLQLEIEREKEASSASGLKASEQLQTQGDEINALISERNNLQRTSEEQAKENHRLNVNNGQLEDSLRQAEYKIVELQGQVSDIDNALREKNEELARALAFFDQEKKNLESAHDEQLLNEQGKLSGLEQQLSQYQADLNQQKSIGDNLVAELDSANQLLSGIRLQLETSEQNYSEAKDKIDALTAELIHAAEQHKRQFDALQPQLDEQQKEALKQLRQTLDSEAGQRLQDALEHQKQSLESKAEARLQEALQPVSQQLSEAHQTITRLQDEHSCLREKQSELIIENQSILSQKEKDLEALRQKLEQQDAQHKAVEETLNRRVKELLDSEAETRESGAANSQVAAAMNQQLTRSIKTLNQALTDEKADKEKWQTRFSELERQSKDSSEIQDKEIESLQNQLTHQIDRAEQLSVQIAGLEKKYAQVADSSIDLNRQIKTANEALNSSRRALEFETSEKTELQIKLNEAHSERDKAQRKMITLQAEVKRLTPPETTDKSVQAEPTIAEMSIQHDENDYIHDFIREWREKNDSDISTPSTSSDFESLPSEGSNTSSRVSDLEDELAESKRLSSRGLKGLELLADSVYDQLAGIEGTNGKDLWLDLAVNNLKTRYKNLSIKLAHNKQILEKQDREQVNTSTGSPPSHEYLRKGYKTLFSDYVKELAKCKSDFLKELEPEKNNASEDTIQSVDGVIDRLNQAIKVTEIVSDIYRRLQEAFEGEIQQYQKILDAIDGDSLDEIILGTQASLKVTLSQENPEVRDYLAGLLVNSSVRAILECYQRSLSALTGTELEVSEGKRKILDQHRSALQRLLPMNLPLDMGKQLDALGAEYINNVVSRQIAELEQGMVLQTANGEQAPDVRGKSGLSIAREMIADAQIRPAVLSLLSSVQPSHEGVKTDLDYFSASVVGLKFIRDEYGLLQIPAMAELLKVAIEDLKQDGSMLAIEAESQHLGQSQDKSNVNRRKKLRLRCEEYLKKEDALKLAGDLKTYYRGQSLQGDRLAKHPHAYVVECFKNQSVFDDDRTGKTRVTAAGVITDIQPNSHGLMNNFLGGTPKGATLLVNETAHVKSLQLKDGYPEDVTFTNKDDNHWQVSLASSHWTVDPAFILDNPDLVISL